VRRWLDLDAAPEAIDEALANLPGEPGLRLPGSVDSFEMVVRAVLGQQVTVAAARTLARRFADRFGEAIETPWPEVTHAFPSAERIAAAPVEQIGELGIIRTRAGAIQALARAWPEATRHLHEKREPEPLIEMLEGLPGIGPWTAHYIAMRALSWPDAFPPNDVAVLWARVVPDDFHARSSVLLVCSFTGLLAISQTLLELFPALLGHHVHEWRGEHFIEITVLKQFYIRWICKHVHAIVNVGDGLTFIGFKRLVSALSHVLHHVLEHAQ